MKFFFTAFGIHNKYIITRMPDHAIFPLSKETEGGLDLDYTALMLGNEFVIDRVAHELVLSGEKSFLTPMARTLRFLEKEGLLSIVDFGATIAGHEHELEKKLNDMLVEPIPWFHIVQRQWEQLRNEFVQFHRLFGNKENALWNTEHFGVINYLDQQGSIKDEGRLDDANKLLHKKRKNYNSRELDQIREIIKPLLAQILINDLIRTKHSQPFLDWDDAKEFYERLYSLRWESITDDIELHRKARILFDAVVPDLKPANIEEVVRFIREDKAVQSMRTELLSCLQNGDNISPEFFLRYSNRAIQRELTLKQKMKKYRLVGAAITSFIPGAGFFQEAAISAAENVIEDAIESTGERTMEWFYALQREAARRQNR